MIVRELVTLLGVRTNQGDIRRAEGGMARLAGAAKAAMAAFASFKLAQWAKGAAEQVANLGDKFDKMSLRTGETATELQGLSHAATLSGTNLGTMEAGIRRLQNATLEAAEGVKRYKVEFKRLGIDVKNSDGTLKSFAQLLPEMADGMEKLKTDTEKSAVAQRLMGRSGTQALPLLKQGSAAIREMIGEVEELGAVLEKDLIDASTKYIDNQARVALINQSVKNSIARGLLPAFISMQEGLLKWWKANQKIINQNLEVVFRSLGG
ncbi:MAG: phage tail tape measure protein, partial [FCB group bacterium]|nr:phage tail tape measure protein [FCB group bacterium]